MTLIMIGGGTMKIFFQLVCGETCTVKPLTTIEWYLVFTCSATLLAQLPNLNSIAGVSLIGAVTAVSYCTLIWVLSISKGRPRGMSYEPLQAKSDVDRLFEILNALGIIAFAFRGHNLVLEIQVRKYSTHIKFDLFSKTIQIKINRNLRNISVALINVRGFGCREPCHQAKSAHRIYQCGEA